QQWRSRRPRRGEAPTRRRCSRGRRRRRRPQLRPPVGARHGEDHGARRLPGRPAPLRGRRGSRDVRSYTRRRRRRTDTPAVAPRRRSGRVPPAVLGALALHCLRLACCCCCGGAAAG
ncbi:Os07g0605275, partial [Oryza sativa Japonica Group]